MNKITAITAILLAQFVTDALAQEYLNLQQDDVIYDVDVIVFARQLSQPVLESINNKASVKTADVLVLPVWDREQDLFQFPEISEPPIDSVPIDNQANPVRVLSDVILSSSMEHPLVDRLSANPTFKPIIRQQWRQAPSAFLNPRYIEVSNIVVSNQTQDDDDDMRFNHIMPDENIPDYSVDGQVAFSEQRFTHLHVKMNLFRVNSEGEQIVYELSQQKRIELDEWQYFDHQQFGVLAKVTAVPLNNQD